MRIRRAGMADAEPAAGAASVPPADLLDQQAAGGVADREAARTPDRRRRAACAWRSPARRRRRHHRNRGLPPPRQHRPGIARRKAAVGHRLDAQHVVGKRGDAQPRRAGSDLDAVRARHDRLRLRGGGDQQRQSGPETSHRTCSREGVARRRSDFVSYTHAGGNLLSAGLNSSGATSGRHIGRKRTWTDASFWRHRRPRWPPLR